MKALTLLYHDVVEHDPDESGFPGAAAGRYKSRRPQFKAHLEAIAARVPYPAVAASPAAFESDHRAFLFSVDDGGASGMHIAAELERLGWRGSFFITTGRTGTPGFLSSADIADLHRRGHSIGSHSVSHPYRMAELSDAEITREWRDSVAALSSILGQRVETASVPGGFYTERVARLAGACGIKVLFNSEPVTKVLALDDCLVVGRFNVFGDATPAAVANLASGATAALLKQQAIWSAKKTAKSLAAPVWDGARKLLFRS